MSENGIAEAEQRVREMNRLTQQYSEQGNRYLQNMMMNAQNARQTRFEPVGQSPQQKSGQDNFSGNSPQQPRQRQEQPRRRNFRLQNACPPRNSPPMQRENPRGTQQNCFPQPHQGSSCPSPVHSGHENHSSSGIHDHSSSNSRTVGFPDLFADNEKLMLLLLMYLLIREKADIKLILALGYLLL